MGGMTPSEPDILVGTSTSAERLLQQLPGLG